MKTVSISYEEHGGYVVNMIEDNECTASTAYGNSPEDMRDAVRGFFEEWRTIMRENEVAIWSMSWRGNGGWKTKWFLSNPIAMEKKTRQLKFDRIHICKYDKMMLPEVKALGHTLTELK